MKISNQIRVRFAPSPTGMVHIGSLRTALFNWIFARKHDGEFILRIEDTDRRRYVKGSVENLLLSLEWIGIDFDEGPYRRKAAASQYAEIAEKGDYGPYFQSRRLDIYRKYAEELLERDAAYWCDCSSKRLREIRKEQQKSGKLPMYDRKCRDRGLKYKEGCVLRLKVPLKNSKSQIINNKQDADSRLQTTNKLVTRFTDLIKGEVIVDNVQIDDQVLLKSDGYPTYHLAVVVDDYLMKISHVIRGDEWLISTPKHVLLYSAFEWELPDFIHLPLILAPDKSKLSKRHGSVSVEEFKKEGYIPEALANFIALLGWHPEGEEEFFSMKNLIKIFDVSRIQKSPAVFNREKLDSMNGHYIRRMEVDDFAKKSMPFLDDNHRIYDFTYIKRAVATEQRRIKKFSEIREGTKFFFTDIQYEPKILIWKKSNKNKTKKNLRALIEFLKAIGEGEWEVKILEKKIKDFISDNRIDNGSLLWPMRVALTGREASPGPFEVSAVLGKEKTLERLQEAINML